MQKGYIQEQSADKQNDTVTCLVIQFSLELILVTAFYGDTFMNGVE
jgi:hypothetical protein